MLTLYFVLVQRDPRRVITAKKRKPPAVASPADMPTDETPTKSLKHIQPVMVSKNAHIDAALIREVLHAGEKYDVIDIQEINTRDWGPKLIWTFKGVKDAVIEKVFGCRDLHQFVTGSDGHLDCEKRAEMIKNVTVLYKGFQTLEGGKCVFSKYAFEFLQKKKTRCIAAYHGINTDGE